jgi:hypothetical protein
VGLSMSWSNEAATQKTKAGPLGPALLANYSFLKGESGAQHS